MTSGALGAWANPMAGNPLLTKADVKRAVVDLVEPVVGHLSAGGARARLGTFGAHFAPRVAELEGYARPLWGIVPLVAGGGRFDHWDRWVAGLAHGTDPESAEYWGPCTDDIDQRMVEMAAISTIRWSISGPHGPQYSSCSGSVPWASPATQRSQWSKVPPPATSGTMPHSGRA